MREWYSNATNDFFNKMRSIIVTMSFLCVQCPKSFSRKYHLNRHIESDHLNKKILCDKCGKEFSREDSLQRHAISCKTVTGNHYI